MIRATKKLLSILDGHQKKMIIVIGFMMLLGGIMESLSVSLILPLISAVMDSEGWNTVWYAQVICDLFHIEQQQIYIQILLVILIGIFIIKNAYLLVEYYVQYSFVAKSRVKLQRKLMHKYTHKSYSFYLGASTGEIVRIVTGDTSQAFGLLTNILNFYTEIIVSIILGITVFIMSPQIGAGLVVILMIEVLVIAKIVKPMLRKHGQKFRSENGLVNKWLLQAINGIKSIKVANREEFFEEKYGIHADRSVEADRSQQTLANVPRLLIEAFTVVGVLLLLFIFVMMGGELSSLVPQLSAFVVAAMRLLPSVNRISAAINHVPFYEGAVDNVIKTLNDVDSIAEIQEQTIDVTDSREMTFNTGLELENVVFGYPDSVEPVLDGACIEIKPGQSVGIVGSSGAGKTTVIDIMLGLLKPQNGRVLVDGADINSNIKKWHQLLAYIPQSIFLMDDTIRENVAFGVHREDIDDEQVWRALRDAQLEDLVKEIPGQLDASIGEAGIKLSGGQRQRLGIARALYNNPEILFFDEATSALDVDTESAIMESIDNLKGRKTLVIIAHRLTTIQNCDVVYRVEKGKIVRER